MIKYQHIKSLHKLHHPVLRLICPTFGLINTLTFCINSLHLLLKLTDKGAIGEKGSLTLASMMAWPILPRKSTPAWSPTTSTHTLMPLASKPSAHRTTYLLRTSCLRRLWKVAYLLEWLLHLYIFAHQENKFLLHMKPHNVLQVLSQDRFCFLPVLGTVKLMK